MQAPGGGLKSAVSGIQFSRSKQQLASGCTAYACVLLLCCTYVRGPDLKAGVHFSTRPQVGNSPWVFVLGYIYAI